MGDTHIIVKPIIDTYSTLQTKTMNPLSSNCQALPCILVSTALPSGSDFDSSGVASKWTQAVDPGSSCGF